mmetsp:Transcript_22811/g.25749  ORF Transcript_22811/g.25749 Transcript_22811/m.25749 type:complete len:90 (-) Transcript_22811:492-761(-)
MSSAWTVVKRMEEIHRFGENNSRGITSFESRETEISKICFAVLSSEPSAIALVSLDFRRSVARAQVSLGAFHYLRGNAKVQTSFSSATI